MPLPPTRDAMPDVDPAGDQRPGVDPRATRKSMACFGAVSLKTGKFGFCLCETFDAKTFETFLKLLLRRRTRGKRMVIVLDNARYHHARLLAPLLHRYRKAMTLVFLPPYSPQLAPFERVWKLTRQIGRAHV